MDFGHIFGTANHEKKIIVISKPETEYFDLKSEKNFPFLKPSTMVYNIIITITIVIELKTLVNGEDRNFDRIISLIPL